MKNIEIKKEGNKVVITIDLTKDFGPSSSGKTKIIASTEGNQEIATGIYLGVNCYKK